VADLDGRQPERMVPDLSRITAVTSLLGDPQSTYPTIHVTGTNGKSTTSRVVAELGCSHGLTAGCYTSPHLLSVTERLSVCGEPISEDEFGEEYERLLPVLQQVDQLGPDRVTYFEVLTALAYLWFADKPVGLGVFEVGMGGTWDATNLVSGDVAVICPISLDHPELGATTAEVAAEKAGIVKEGKVAVVREQPPEARSVIEARCREMEAQLLVEDRDWGLAGRLQGVGGQVLTVEGLFATYEGLRLPLFGEHAARNAAASVVAFEAFVDRRLDQRAVEEAFGEGSVPGRLQVANRHPLVVLDGAHNPAGAEALALAIRESFTFDRLHLVVAISSNKDVQGIVAPLAPLADRAYAARHSSVRSAPAEAVRDALATFGLDAEAFDSVGVALEAALSAADEGDLILVTGSLYTVGDALRAIPSTSTQGEG